MYSRWFQWMVLNSLIGSPALSFGILVVFWWAVDHFTLGLLPDPVRGLARWQRAARLRQLIATNPHDRRSRFELADLLLLQKRHAAAVEVLKPNLEAGDDDAATLFLMGVACFGAGHAKQGEVFLNEARKADAGYRQGSIDLELGRDLLQAGHPGDARPELERYCAEHPGTVEGRVLLCRALEALGQAQAAQAARQAAWEAYTQAPRFQRRRERWWAWRAKPSRPVAYAAVALALGAGLARLSGPAVKQLAPPQMSRPGYVPPTVGPDDPE